MTAIRFVAALRIAARHGFFGGDACPDLTVVPTAATARALARLGVRARVQPGETTLWIAAPEDAAASAAPAPALSFWLRVSDPAFAVYTEPEWRGGAAPGRIVALAVPGGPAAAAAAARQGAALPRRPARFTETLTGPSEGASACVTAPPAPAVLWSGSVSAGRVAIDLTGQTEGWYRLSTEGAADVDFVLDPGIGAAPFGLLAVAPGDIAAAASGQAPPLLAIDFAARALPWEYVVLTATTLDLAAGRIDGGSGAPAFGPPWRCDMRGRVGWAFRSAAPAAIGARGGTRLQLTPGARGLPDSVPLPAAGPSSLARDDDGAPIFRMFVAL